MVFNEYEMFSLHIIMYCSSVFQYTVLCLSYTNTLPVPLLLLLAILSLLLQFIDCRFCCSNALPPAPVSCTLYSASNLHVSVCYIHRVHKVATAGFCMAYIPS